MGWEFPVLLISALVLSVGLSWWQTRHMNRALNELAAQHSGERNILVSGRGRGALRGAVAMLVIDPVSRTVVAARTMVGSTVFARIRPAPELLGPVKGAADRAQDPKTRLAIEEALAQYNRVRASRR